MNDQHLLNKHRMTTEKVIEEDSVSAKVLSLHSMKMNESLHYGS